MVRLMQTPVEIHASETFLLSSPISLALGLFISATLVVALCAKHRSSKANHPNKAKKKRAQQESDAGKVNDEESAAGVWQKAIMMGERCQPPEFSGVIYYDYSGNRIPEMPKSPRPSSMSPLRSFNFPVEKE